MAYIEQKRTLYVGGVDESVSEEVLHAAFIPFGDLKLVQIPRDYSNNKHRGFAFVEFEEEGDAKDAIENMDGSELFGKVLRCSIAKAAPKLAAGKAVWSTEEWVQNSMNDETLNIVDDDKVAELTLIPERRYDGGDEE